MIADAFRVQRINLGREPIVAASGPGGERLSPPDLSIVECRRYNIIPRDSTSALPAWLRDSPSFVAGLNHLNDGLTAFLPVFTQNWFFFLRKP